MSEKQTGTISYVRFGMGGYDDSMYGLTVRIDSGDYSWGDFIGFFVPNDLALDGNRARRMLADQMRVYMLLKDAKVDDVTKLVGKAVEFELADAGLSPQLAWWRLRSEQ